MAQNPFEALGREFHRAIEEHGQLLNEEMKRVQIEMQSAMAQVKDEMERVGIELQRAMEEFHRRRSDHIDWGDSVVTPERPGRRKAPISPKKRPRRRPPGAAAAPVKPRPKPKPLVDGAEAPIE